MKKAGLCTVLLTIMLWGISASAANVEYTDAVNDVISVSGAAKSGENVSLLILHEGYGTDDIPDQAADAQEYVASQVCDNNSYSFKIRLIPKNTNQKERFVFLISKNGSTEKFEWEYYPSGLKLEEIEKLNQAENVNQIYDCMESLYVAYGVSGHPLSAASYTSGAAKALFEIKKAVNRFPADINKMMQYLREAMLVGAYNAHDAGALITDGMLNYSDILNIADSDYYTDYKDAISVNGRNVMNQTLVSGNFGTVEEITKQFKQQVLYNVLMRYKEAGFSQFDTYFSKYKDDYVAVGFNLNNSLNGKNAIYTALLNSNAANLETLATEYNKLVNDNKSLNGASGGIGGGGGGGISGGTLSSDLKNGQGYAPTTDKDSEETKTLVFSDLDNVPWASNAIEELYKSGVVNGKEINLFCPDDNVTRAEFAKMLSIIFALDKTNGSMFTDTKGHWAEGYVSACAAAEIVNGYEDGSFQPENYITREQGAVMVYRAILKQNIEPADGKREFADQNKISDYAKKAVSVMAYNKVINGTDENCFMPLATLTRAEAAVLLSNVTKYMAKQ